MPSPTLSTTVTFALLQRCDGVGLGLTSHDLPLERDGYQFEPAPGFALVDFATGRDLREWTLRCSLAASVMQLTGDDNRRWHGADCRIFAGEWDSASPLRLLGRGSIGKVTRTDALLDITLLCVPERLAEPACPVTSPTCRATLGDADCRVAMREKRMRATVRQVAGQTITLEADRLERFAFGRLRLLRGMAAGMSVPLFTASGATVTLTAALEASLREGDEVELTEGCDGLIDTCRNRFGNVLNFRGEPYMPGSDLLTRYPGA